MVLVRVHNLPDEPIAAAAAFYTQWAKRLQESLAEIPLPLEGGVRGGPVAVTGPPPAPAASGRGAFLLIAFPPADHAHTAWRSAAIQSLAREFAPRRVNGVASADEAAIAAAEAYLAGAEGLTGQYLPLDGQGADNPVTSSLRA